MEPLENNAPLARPLPTWAGWLIAALLAGLTVCLVLDREATKVMSLIAWLILALTAIVDREHRSWRRLVTSVAATAAVTALTSGFAYFAGEGTEAIQFFFKYQVGVIWLVIAYLAIPVMSWPADHKWVKTIIFLILALALQGTLSAGASMFPKDSMKLLGAELLPYAGLFIVAVRTGGAWIDGITRYNQINMEPPGREWWPTGLRGMWLILTLTCASMGVLLLAAIVYPPLAEALLKQNFFRHDSDAPGMWRLQFLFQHHNRAGFFAAVGIFICLVGATKHLGWRILGVFGAASALLALPFTLTRAALVAAAAGLALFTVAGLVQFKRGRWLLLAGVILVVPALWNFLPESYQGHISKITNIANYREGAGGSIGARLVMWETAGDMIQKRPGLGFGYGFENFEAAAQADNPDVPNYFDDAVHAHNMWLETSAEIGLPGAALLLAFTLIRLGGLTAAWWHGMRNRQALAWLLLLWLCLEIVIQLYNLTNYTLRRNLGYLTYGVWAGSVLLVIQAKSYGLSQRNQRDF